MRYAVFSDIHGNIRAWNAIHRDMVELEADILVCLGDVVGYGPMPREVLTAIRGVTDNFVLGNHDAAAAGIMDPSLFNENAEKVILWTRDRLDPESLDFLNRTPLGIDTGDLLFVHAEIREPARFGYIETGEDARGNLAANNHFLTFIGHTHHPALFDLDEKGRIQTLPDEDRRLDPSHRYLVNVGSAGEPRHPEDIRARYLIYDAETRDVYFRRIAFDVEGYRRDLAATSLDITPYFLRVADRQAAIEAEAQHAMTVDMRTPSTSQGYIDRFFHAGAARRLIPEALVETSPGAGSKPKPKPSPSRRKRRLVASIGLLSILLLLAGVGAVLFRPSPIGPRQQPEPADAQPAGPPPAKTARSPEDAPGVPPPPVDSVKPRTADPPDPKPPTARSLDPGIVAGPEPEPKPEPEPAPPPPAVLAYWRMGAGTGDEELADSAGTHILRARAPGRVIGNLAPNPVPLTGAYNDSALTLGIWAEPEASGTFDLSTARSFSLEGWVMTYREQKPIFIAGTQTGGEGTGWRLDMLAAPGARARGSIRFVQTGAGGTTTVQSNEIDFYDPDPHHFAVVWNHRQGGSGRGTLGLFFDGVMVASGAIPFSEIAGTEASPFQIGAESNPAKVAIDEVRLSGCALDPGRFLSLGKGPDTSRAVAIMIDVGDSKAIYNGNDSPAHAEGAVPGEHTHWIAANHEYDARQHTRFVRRANGETYPLPLTIDLGKTRSENPEHKVDWGNSLGDIRGPAGKGGLFRSTLMDSALDPSGKRSVGLRVRGLEAGEYTVYFTPLIAPALRSDIRFGIGVDRGGARGTIGRADAMGMRRFVYRAGSAAAADAKWELDRNYFRHEVTIADPNDYIVVVVAPGDRPSAIPFLQIVKHGLSNVPLEAPIEFRFEDRGMANHSALTHPCIANISDMRSTGFTRGSVKIEGKTGNRSLGGGVVRPGPQISDYFHFSFQVTGPGARLDGFSMDVSGPPKLRRAVFLMDDKGKKVAELFAPAPAPSKPEPQALGTLGGAKPLAVPLRPGTYEIRVAASGTSGKKKFTVDNVRVDFGRR